MTITKLATDPPEWKLYDKDFTELGILKGLDPTLYLKQNDCGSGSMLIPISSPLLSYLAEPEDALFKFIGLNYRGDFRGGFFVEQHEVVEVSSEEYAGWALKLSGRGMLSLLDDGIVPDWMTPGVTDIRYFGINDLWSAYGQVNISKGMMLYNELYDAVNDVVNGIGQHLNSFIWHVGGLLANPVLLSWDFTDTLDSDGNAWTDAESLEFRVGTSILDMVRQFAALEYDFTIDFDMPNKCFVLHAYKTRVGTDKSNSVIFWVGKNCVNVSRTANGVDIRNSILVQCADPLVPFVTANDLPSQAAYRKRHSLLQAMDATKAKSALSFGVAELDSTKDPKKDIALAVYDGTGSRVFIDYNIGDTVGYRGVPNDVLRTYKVSGLQLTWAGDNKYADVIVEVGTE